MNTELHRMKFLELTKSGSSGWVGEVYIARNRVGHKLAQENIWEYTINRCKYRYKCICIQIQIGHRERYRRGQGWAQASSGKAAVFACECLGRTCAVL